VQDNSPLSNDIPLSLSTLHSWLENHLEGIIVSQLDGTILYTNQAVSTLSNYNISTLKKLHLSELLGLDLIQLATTENNQHHATRLESTLKCANHDTLPVEITYHLIQENQQPLLLCALENIAERLALQKELYKKSITDSLTGLFNRRHFDERLAKEFSRAQRYRRPFSTIIIDVDGFKQANDLHGHAYGDSLLIRARDVFLNLLRGNDTVYRYGGDEFALILPETAKEGTIELTNRLRQSFARQCSDKEKRIKLSLSIGVASYPEDGTDQQALIGAADRRMYHSKENGGNMITAYDVSPQQDTDTDTLLRSLGALVRLMENQRGMNSNNGISHSQEIRTLAIEIGSHMGLNSRRLRLLEQASMLHDIGTLYIPDTILKKDGMLSDSEWTEIKKHTLIGEQIIGMVTHADQSELQDLKQIVAQHHEWVNGQGYPHGLQSEHIMTEAKILATTDAYNAMITKRPYRKTLTKLEALGELQHQAGVQFCPTIVEHLVSLETTH